jgi:hypothetical protein
MEDVVRSRGDIGRTLGIALALAASTGCKDEPHPWEVVPSAPVAPASERPETAIASARAEHMELQRFVFTSDVRNKEPVDTVLRAQPGDRVYAHVTLRNRTGRTRRIVLDFSVNGSQRTNLSLDVEHAWSWRTWGYNTILESDDVGELLLRVTDDEGTLVTEARLPIGRKRDIGKAPAPVPP